MPERTININFSVGRVEQKGDGCGIASAAMMVNYLNRKNYNFDEMFDINGSGDYETQWPTIANKQNLKFKMILSGTTNSTFNALKKELFDILYFSPETPVIVRVANLSTDRKHYVVVNGFSGKVQTGVDPDNINYGSITAEMFRVVDPGIINNHTLEDVMDSYGGYPNADLRRLYFFYK
ncbi:hypothetical protein OXPF_00040 [Oxobacter pfennigii]|uniref:Peptidase C39-like domain-containing protein n=1 Tax=Oxobacter pfennigii TaxID=36849 RepID=A0A0P9ALU7_9CLOT|nr:C39 family peptidase [Oxobacter pfennigii]KPU46387.1 hypothetical protein OXPF_00040 [Oxobacter pfennigii]